MTRKTYIRVALIVAGCLVMFSAITGRNIVDAQSQPKSATRQNVVLIVIDTLRADRVAGRRHGVPLMPNLSRVAEDSVNFTRAVTQCTWTAPAVASIFTSLHMDTHQVYFRPNLEKPGQQTGDALSPAFETIATYLHKAGFRAAVIQSNINLTAELGFARDFDPYVYLPNKTASEITARAIEEAGKLPEPFFLYVHYLDPHVPYAPPAEYRQLLGWPPAINPTEMGVVTHFLPYMLDYCDYKLGIKKNPSFPPLSPAAREAVQTLYDGEVRFVDDQLAKLLDFLKTAHRNSLIIIVADHGEQFWDHDFLGHGVTLYDEELKVPFFMLGPGLEPRKIDRNVETFDILPTIAALLGLPPNPAWQGHDLFAGGKGRPVYSHTRGSWLECNTDLEMLETGDLKLILNRRTNQAELYDLAADPLEKTDLASQHPKDVETMKALVDTRRQCNIEARAQNTPQRTSISPEAVEQLKSIGYGR